MEEDIKIHFHTEKELKKYKYSDIEEFNCFSPYSYHRCLTKYSRDNKKEKKNNKGSKR